MEALEEDQSKLPSTPASKRPRTCTVPRDSFTVAWVCAITTELVAAQQILDEEYGSLSGAGSNIYTCGRVAEHNVLIVHLAYYGTNSAAEATAQLNIEFPSIRIRLMVGIGGGIPSEDSDIRLGDVVVSRPKGSYPGVVQYDMFKSHANRATEYIGSLTPPPPLLLKASVKVEAAHSEGKINLLKQATAAAKRPESSDDLFETSYNHVEGPTCARCNRQQIRDRTARPDYEPCIHYGLIASGNRVVKDGTDRDRIRNDFKDALCFEMEAAGLMNTFSCLVIRGICDYADSHKNKEWQPYAAATAAAYAKELISVIPPQGVLAHQPQAPPSSTKTSPEDMKKALRSLRFSDMDFRKNDIGEESYGTCRWFREHEKYRAWLRQACGLLWLKGNPGVGKSTIVKYVVNETTCSLAPNTDILASFFFHARAGPDSLQTKALGLYRSILYQILSKIPELLSEFSSEFQHVVITEGQVPDIWIKYERELRKSFKNYVIRASKVYAVYLFIDALDESDGNMARDIVELLSHSVLASREGSGNLHICFSCRHYPNFDSPGSLTIEVEAENERDIVTYIYNELQDRPEALQLKDNIVQKSRGIFQWTALVVAMIAELHDDGDYAAMIDRLEGMPEGLDPLYDDILDKVLESRNATLGIWLLKCICFSLHPLSIDDARWIMVLTPDCKHTTLDAYKKEPTFCVDNVQVSKRVKSLTWGLAGFVDCRPLFWRSESNDCMEVQFIHQSVQDYLTRDRFRQQDPSFSVTDQYLLMSMMCLKYLTLTDLNFPNYVQSRCRVNAMGRRRTEFTTHACDWQLYALRAQEGDGSHLNALPDIEQYIPRSSRMLKNTCPLISITFSDYSDNWAIFLHVVAYYGLHRLLEPLLDHANINPNKKDENGDTPLTMAVKGSTLLDLHSSYPGFSNIKMDGKRKVTVEYDYQRALRTLEVLLGNRLVDRNSRDKSGFTPLSNAVLRDFPAAVRLLLADRQVDPNLSDNTGCTPFSLAARYAGIVTLEVLLGNRLVDRNSRDKSGFTPLSNAVLRDFPAAVRLLLADRQVDPNLSDNTGRTPFSLAARYAGIVTLEVLLGNRLVDKNSRDENGLTPLSNAVLRDFPAVVRLLLADRQIDPNLSDNTGRTPFSLAAQYASIVTFEEFLKLPGVEPHWRNAHGQTALHLAAQSNKHPEFKIDSLLGIGFDADALDNNMRTSLSWTAELGCAPAVAYLLERTDVDVNAKDIDGRTPLSWAAGEGHELVVDILLRRADINVNARDLRGRTPLSWAAENGCSLAAAHLLKKNDVDVNARDDTGRTPLSWAASSCHLCVVRDLLRSRAVDPNIPDESGSTPLFWAIMSRHSQVWPKIAEELVERAEGEINKPDKFGRTPLSLAVENDVLVEFICSSTAQREKRALAITERLYPSDSEDHFGHSPLWYVQHRQRWATDRKCCIGFEDPKESQGIAAAIEQRISDEYTGSRIGEESEYRILSRTII
ncbi:MAG: hypothetical protein M1820_002213 [Bogoriella megaspora]|nr:MAG: hypothetical protein M1820_002213 [Bogoriella megaspora]